MTIQLPDYKDDPEAYEIEETSRPDEMAMIGRAASFAIEHLDGCTNANVLDLCCGTGLSMRDLVRHSNIASVVGVDISQQYLAFSRARFKDLPHVSFLHGDAVECELPEMHWDVVVLASAYHHIEDERKVRFLHRVARLLKPGGCAVMAENILPPYQSGDSASYSSAVALFYREVLGHALAVNKELPPFVQGLIHRVAQYGHDGDYEYKVCMNVFLDHLSQCPLRIERVEKVWPDRGPLSVTSGGNYSLLLKHGDVNERQNGPFLE